MPATATKPTSTAHDIARRYIEDSETMFEEAERILFHLAEAGDDYPDPADVAILRAVGIEVDNPNGLRSEIARASRVAKLQRAAGSGAEFKAAEAALVKAKQADETDGPALEKSIAELQQKLDKLRSGRTEAEARLAGMNKARETLRDPQILPEFIRKRFERAQSGAKRRWVPDVGRCENRIRQIDEISGFGPEEQFQHAKVVRPELLERDAAGHHKPRVDQRAWAAFIDDMQRERAKLVREVGPLRKEFDLDRSAAEELRNYYVSQL